MSECEQVVRERSNAAKPRSLWHDCATFPARLCQGREGKMGFSRSGSQASVKVSAKVCPLPAHGVHECGCNVPASFGQKERKGEKAPKAKKAQVHGALATCQHTCQVHTDGELFVCLLAGMCCVKLQNTEGVRV